MAIETKKKIGLCFMCATVTGLKADEETVFEDDDIIVVKDKANKSKIHLLVYPKKHIEEMGQLLKDKSMIAMLRFVENFVIDESRLGEKQFCIYLANCPRHPHLHMQILCGSITSLAIDGIGTPNPSPGT